MKLTIAELQGRAKHVSILNYGPPKTGKTQVSATAERPIWFWDFDNNCESLVRKATEQNWPEGDLVVYRYLPPGGDKIGTSVQRPRGKDVYLEILKDINGLYDLVDLKTGEWKTGAKAPRTIVFDSLSAYQDLVMDFVLNMRSHDLNEKGTDARADYGAQMGKIEETIVSTNGLPCTSIWIAHEVLDKDETTSQIRCDPYVTGKLAARIARHFGVVLYSTGQNGKYQWYVKPQGYVRTVGSTLREFKEGVVDQDYRNVL